MENKIKCTCCGYLTVSKEFDICPVCYWQKDYFQENNIFDDSGPNLVSLDSAKKNFIKYQAIDEEFINFVRPPFQWELIT